MLGNNYIYICDNCVEYEFTGTMDELETAVNKHLDNGDCGLRDVTFFRLEELNYDSTSRVSNIRIRR